MEILNQLQELIEQAKTRRSINQYIYGDNITAYIRITSRLIDRQMVKTIDIGNVEVNKESQGKGVFKDFLEGVELIAKREGRAVYIESILSPILMEKLPQYGYTSNNEICPSFHKTF